MNYWLTQFRALLEAHTYVIELHKKFTWVHFHENCHIILHEYQFMTICTAAISTYYIKQAGILLQHVANFVMQFIKNRLALISCLKSYPSKIVSTIIYVVGVLIQQPVDLLIPNQLFSRSENIHIGLIQLITNILENFN